MIIVHINPVRLLWGSISTSQIKDICKPLSWLQSSELSVSERVSKVVFPFHLHPSTKEFWPSAVPLAQFMAFPKDRGSDPSERDTHSLGTTSNGGNRGSTRQSGRPTDHHSWLHIFQLVPPSFLQVSFPHNRQSSFIFVWRHQPTVEGNY